ncbi:hypothetical protein BH09PSE3_BH09PSE3_28480 [soil metagenome]
MLTPLSIRALKPQSKPYKVSDGKGLFLLAQPSGAKLWRLRFRHRGIERKLALGRFPDMSLQKARAMRDEAQGRLVDGIDPVIEKRRLKLEAALAAATTFRLVADEYIEKMERERKADATLKKARWLRDLFDKDIGPRPVAEIEPHELLSVSNVADTMKRRSGFGNLQVASFVIRLRHCGPIATRQTSCAVP